MFVLRGVPRAGSPFCARNPNPVVRRHRRLCHPAASQPRNKTDKTIRSG